MFQRNWNHQPEKKEVQKVVQIIYACKDVDVFSCIPGFQDSDVSSLNHVLLFGSVPVPPMCRQTRNPTSTGTINAWILATSNCLGSAATSQPWLHGIASSLKQVAFYQSPEYFLGNFSDYVNVTLLKRPHQFALRRLPNETHFYKLHFFSWNMKHVCIDTGRQGSKLWEPTSKHLGWKGVLATISGGLGGHGQCRRGSIPHLSIICTESVQDIL